ncbi:MAG: hypothetical protein A4S17_09030 [Proteobacteria bacterium HN_bin10]|nr:MAG: hypothetical protein A4S17_09030 [Proteobacteria bacterium HN_bin10]
MPSFLQIVAAGLVLLVAVALIRSLMRIGKSAVDLQNEADLLAADDAAFIYTTQIALLEIRIFEGRIFRDAIADSYSIEVAAATWYAYEKRKSPGLPLRAKQALRGRLTSAVLRLSRKASKHPIQLNDLQDLFPRLDCEDANIDEAAIEDFYAATSAKFR